MKLHSSDNIENQEKQKEKEILQESPHCVFASLEVQQAVCHKTLRFSSFFPVFDMIFRPKDEFIDDLLAVVDDVDQIITTERLSQKSRLLFLG